MSRLTDQPNFKAPWTADRVAELTGL